MAHVLLIGFTGEASIRGGGDAADDPDTAAALQSDIERGDAAVTDHGHQVTRVWVTGDHERGVADTEAALTSATFDVVLIGGGIRGHAETTDLFERLVNAAHTAAPTARFAFNTSPDTSLAAVERVLGDGR